MTTRRPIEIIGGGLAGLSLGLALRRHGIPVTVFEAGAYPRHRVCGEFITGLDPATIERLGLAPALDSACTHRTVAWFLRDDLTTVQHLPHPALGISRYTLDARLAAAFVAAGGELKTRTRAPDLTPQPGRILATGRRRGTGEWLGLKVHVRGLALERDLELHLGEDAYVGLAGIEDGAVNVCGLFRRRRVHAPSDRSGFTPRSFPSPQNAADLLFAYLGACGLPALSARLRGSAIDSASACAVAALAFDAAIPGRGNRGAALRSGERERADGFPFRSGERGRAGPPAPDQICLGDRCAMIPPFTGNGMAMAFQSAVAALDPVLAYARGESSWTEACRGATAAERRRFGRRLRTASLIHGYLLRPRRQRLLALLTRARLLPFRPLYALLH